MLLPINYNRSAKQYEVAYNQHLATFATKDRAMQFTVAAADRRIAKAVMQLAKSWPTLQERAWRAAQLFLSGNVTQTANGFTVKSQRDSKTYSIDAKLNQCNCTDCSEEHAPHGPGNRRWCKHMIACSLFIRFPPQQTVVNGRHRNRSVQQTFINIPPGQYQNGRPIEPNLINYAATFRSSNGRPPYDKEKLLSWIYR